MKTRYLQFPGFLQESIEKYNREREIPFDGHPTKQRRSPNLDAIYINNNDYLHLADAEELRRAYGIDAELVGAGPQMSGIYVDDENHPKIACERSFAEFLGYESVELTQSGYAANVGLIQAVTGRDIPVFIDQFAHFSFAVGTRTARAKIIQFQHNSIDSLEQKIKEFGSGVIAVDSLYSTMGTIAPLEEICKLASRYDCLLVVDESHSLGTYGPSGAGLVYELGLQNSVHFVTASLSKCFVTRAGIVASTRAATNFFKHVSFQAIFSSMLELYDVKRCSRVLEIIKRSDDRRNRLFATADLLRSKLLELGFDLTGDGQIISIFTGDEANLVKFVAMSEELGIYGAPFCWPATSVIDTVYRLSVHSELSEEDIGRIVEAYKLIASRYPHGNQRSML